MAAKYNIGASTVSELFKRRTDIENAVEKDRLTGKRRKTLKDSAKPDVETVLNDWLIEQKEQGHLPTNKDIIHKAREINMMLKPEEEGEAEYVWNPTKGWLSRFKDRFNIKTERTPTRDESIKPWQSSNFSDINLIALEAAEYLLDYINNRDFQLKDVITVRMIRDKIACENETQALDF